MISTAGRELRQPPLQHQDQHDPGDPDRSRGGDRIAVGQALDEPGQLAGEAVGVDLEPEQLGQLADQDGQRQAVHVADHRRLGDQVGDEPEPGHRPQHQDAAGHEREHRRQRDGARRVAAGAGQRQDRRGDHRPERGVRAQHQDPRRAEHRVAEQAQDGGVQAGDRRQPRQLGVRHALRHEQGAEHDPGHDVLGQPLPPEGDQPAQQSEHRHLHFGSCAGQRVPSVPVDQIHVITPDG
jgi:hypothetical protein